MLCITACPVKYCNDASLDYVGVVSDECIGCGACIDVCRPGARSGMDDSDKFFEDAAKFPMVAIVAPAVAAVFPDDYLRLNSYLKGLGVKAVMDVSFGAELTVKSYLEHIKKNKPQAVIAQPCPSLVSWIELYHPELLRHLSPADSPMMHLAKMIQEFRPEFKGHRIAFIGPCLSKRREFDETGVVGYNVTFNSLIARMKTRGESLTSFAPADYDNPPTERAASFSTPGGLLQTLKRWNPDAHEFTHKVEGPAEVYNYLEELSRQINEGGTPPLLVDCLNCALGCNGGPGTPNRKVSHEELSDRVQKRVQQVCASWESRGSNKPEATKFLIEDIIESHWKEGLYQRSYVNRSGNVALKEPSAGERKNIFNGLGIRSAAEESNCRGCGYDSCADFARAILNGRSRANHCRLFRKKRVELLQEGIEKLRKLSLPEGEAKNLVTALIPRLEALHAQALVKPPSPGKPGAPFSEIAWQAQRLAETTDALEVALIAGKINKMC
jgi:iron only hydrogenase large subunit-like protein